MEDWLVLGQRLDWLTSEVSSKLSDPVLASPSSSPNPTPTPQGRRIPSAPRAPPPAHSQPCQLSPAPSSTSSVCGGSVRKKPSLSSVPSSYRHSRLPANGTCPAGGSGGCRQSGDPLPDSRPAPAAGGSLSSAALAGCRPPPRISARCPPASGGTPSAAPRPPFSCRLPARAPAAAVRMRHMGRGKRGEEGGVAKATGGPAAGPR